ncbi:hypothetical protein, partial [Staphylococcus sp. 191]|uniref:hypothetical protein n=1 Tax=Staphylococcus sp. 191 TaxID=2070016 RepID=UPI001A9A1C3D
YYNNENKLQQIGVINYGNKSLKPQMVLSGILEITKNKKIKKSKVVNKKDNYKILVTFMDVKDITFP